MEKDDEIKGKGNSYTTQFRQYDPRLGRWLSLDPLATKYSSISPYASFGNNPIFFTDPGGDSLVDANGKYVRVDYDAETGTLIYSGVGTFTDEEKAGLESISSSEVGRKWINESQESDQLIYPKVSTKLALVPVKGALNGQYKTYVLGGIKAGAYSEEDIKEAVKDDNSYFKVYGLTYPSKTIEGVVVSEVFTLSILFDVDEDFARDVASIGNILIIPKFGSDDAPESASEDVYTNKLTVIPSPGSKTTTIPFKNYKDGVGATKIDELVHATNKDKGGEDKPRKEENKFLKSRVK
jgi:RHS repeat-associated protein